MKTQEKIMLGHGSGGLMMKHLLEDVFFEAYAGPELLVGDDAAVLDSVQLDKGQKFAFSTDSYVVNPDCFPGGDIGKLAVCGTVNDVSTSGAKPIAISVSFIIAEGYQISKLKDICKSIANAAKEAGVKIVTGDTKVVDKASSNGLFVNTAGIGIVDKGINLSGKNCKPGDSILINGSVGDHGMTIMSAREGLKFSSDLKSDAAPLNFLIQDLINEGLDIHAFRDPTRGGVASSLNEFAQQSCVDIEIDEDKVPVKDSVKAACDMLGYDYLQVANEGKMLVVVNQNDAQRAIDIMKQNKYGKDAAIIGKVCRARNDMSNKVYVNTKFGTQRILDMLVGQQLPRIC